MGLLKDPLIGEIKPKALRGLLDNKAQKIVDKGEDVSNLDLYNLCLLNKERDEMSDNELQEC